MACLTQVVCLIEAGNVNGARKAIDRGLHITGMALGDSELFDWLADQPTVVSEVQTIPTKSVPLLIAELCLYQLRGGSRFVWSG